MRVTAAPKDAVCEKKSKGSSWPSSSMVAGVAGVGGVVLDLLVEAEGIEMGRRWTFSCDVEGGGAGAARRWNGWGRGMWQRRLRLALPRDLTGGRPNWWDAGP
jgi:hypothetical protein